MQMELVHWGVWHSFTGYFPTTNLDLSEISKWLIASSLAESVYLSSGNFMYVVDGELANLPLTLERKGFAIEGSFSLAHIEEGNQRQNAGEAVTLRFIETIRGIEPDGHQYARVFLHPIMFDIEGTSYLLYPQAKIFKDGVINVTFRMAPPDVAIDDLVLNKYFMNLRRVNSDKIFVHPSLILWSGIVRAIEAGTPALRGDILKLPGANVEQVSALQFNNQSVKHHLAELDKNEKDSLNLEDLKEIITKSMTLVLCTNMGKRGARFGRQEMDALLPGRWLKQSGTVISEFIGQPDSTEEIVENFGSAIGRLLSRTIHIDDDAARNLLSQNLDAYGMCFINTLPGTNLVVYSRSDVRKRREPHADYPIWNWQNHFELVDHIVVSYMRIQAESGIPQSKARSVFELRKRLLELDSEVRKFSNNPFSQNLISKSLDDYGVAAMHELAVANLDANLAIIQQKSSAYQFFASTVMAIVFGLVGAATLSKDIIHTAFNEYNYIIPIGSRSNELVWYIVVVIPLTFAIVALVYALRRFVDRHY